ncbi:MAG: VWA domain-containing protein [Tumebacillaceae bacterium]
MGQVIRTFLQKRRERKYWRRRLEPVIDRMIEERMAAEEEASGQRIDLNELGNRVDEMTERPTRTGEQRAMQGGGAGDEIDLDADPVSMAGGSGASMSPDVPSEGAGGQPQEQEEREEPLKKESAQHEGLLSIETVSLDDILDELIDPQNTSKALNEQYGFTTDALLENGHSIRLPDVALEDLPDQEVDALKPEFRRLIRQHAEGRMVQMTQTRAPRRKHVDPRATVRRMTRAGGVFNGFSYRPSPSENPNRVDAQHLLVIADVSGSMGRYVGIVLYLLSCLDELATVDSYVFSDATTYASDLLGTGDFAEQFTRLKDGATSWEYGTRLSQALLDVVHDGRFDASTRVVLLTDGGFSLIGSDWPDTVRGLLALHKAVDSIHLVTPNPQLLAEGPACADVLWNVEYHPRTGHELLTSDIQKTARYGLLTRYSASKTLCQTPDDLVHILQTLLA